MQRIFIVCLFLMFSASLFADNGLPVRCTGDKITYNKEKGIMYGSGNVEIGYKDNYIRADKVSFNMKAKIIEAEGRVIVSDGVNIFTGDKVVYDLNSGIAKVDGIGSRMGPWFAGGEGGKKEGKSFYYVKNGYITTCDYERPHYRIKGRDIFIYPGDKIVVKHIIFYWGNMPLFYWPYYSRSLKDERSPWTIIPGYNDDFGAFLLTGYSMWWDNFLGGTFEPTMRFDWYEKRGFGTGMYARYRYKDIIESLIRAYFINDKARDIGGGATDEEARGRLSIDYAQNLSYDTRGILELNWLSDPDIVYDFFRDEFKDEIQTENYINISKTTRKYQLSFMAKKRFHSFYTDTERLPEVTFNLLEQRFKDTRLLYSGSASAGYLAKRFSEANGGKDYSSGRFDTTWQMRYPRKYFHWLNIIPRAGTRQTFWNKRAVYETTVKTEEETHAASSAAAGTVTQTQTSHTGTSTTVTETTTTTEAGVSTVKRKITTTSKKEISRNTLRSIFFTGAEFTTKISRVFYTDSRFWQVHQLRHVIEPRINYVYQHKPTVVSSELLGFGDLAEADNHIELSLRNKLQTKRYNSAWDLVDLWTGVNYYPQEYEEKGCGRRSFSHVKADLELRPFDWISVDMDSDYDQYDKQVDTFNTEGVLYHGDKLSLGLGYRYARGNDKLWTSEINYTINSDWAFRMQHRFEFGSGKLQEQEYILFRDLHCWKLAFTFREYRQLGESTYFIVFYPKAYPNVPVTFGTTFFGRNDTSEIGFGVD